MNCAQCSKPMRAQTVRDVMPNYSGSGDPDAPMEMQTLVGYSSPEGHNHDDNCLTRTYVCEGDHKQIVSKRRTCPACDWKGTESCGKQCGGLKVDEWP